MPILEGVFEVKKRFSGGRDIKEKEIKSETHRRPPEMIPPRRLKFRPILSTKRSH